MSLMALTKLQKLFANEYLIDLNATRAYKAVYKTCKKDETARVNGSKALTNTNISNYIEKRMKDREKRTEITQDSVLKELAKIGFVDITDFVTISGGTVQVRATDDIEKNKLGAIAGIKEGANGIEIKLNDKEKALELIGRHLGMFTDKVEVSGSIDTGKTELAELLENRKKRRGT